MEFPWRIWRNDRRFVFQNPKLFLNCTNLLYFAEAMIGYLKKELILSRDKSLPEGLEVQVFSSWIVESMEIDPKYDLTTWLGNMQTYIILIGSRFYKVDKEMILIPDFVDGKYNRN